MLWSGARILDRRQRRVGVDVTGAGAVTQLANRVWCIRILVFLVWSGLEIAGMATGAVRLIRGERPGDGLGVAAVACGTGELAAMIARIRRRNMRKLQRQPERHGVAVVAVAGAHEMPRILAGRGRAVVTHTTRTGDGVVIEVRGDPCRRRMTVVAFGGRLNVEPVLAGGRYSVVTTRTGARHHGRMIEHGRTPRVGRMAVVAVVAAGNVVRRLAERDATIVTGRTSAEYLKVIDADHRRPGHRAMAVLANIGRVDMHRVPAGGIRSVVATDAVTRNIAVIEPRGQPRRTSMAVLAGRTGYRVIDRFPVRDDTVMAAGAAADDLRVIDTPDRRPRRFQVAVLANGGAQNMIGGHRGRPNQAGACMAATAVTRRAVKHAADMTVLTIRKTMRPLEWKAGCQVIEVRAERRLRHGIPAAQQHGHQQ